jgi:hypothetical protein
MKTNNGISENQAGRIMTRGGSRCWFRAVHNHPATRRSNQSPPAEPSRSPIPERRSLLSLQRTLASTHRRRHRTASRFLRRRGSGRPWQASSWCGHMTLDEFKKGPQRHLPAGLPVDSRLLSSPQGPRAKGQGTYSVLRTHHSHY